MKKISGIQKHIIDRITDGLKEMPAREISAFILQNLAEGFARGLTKELKSEAFE